MTYQDELLRFLEQPENFHFLMEIEPMIGEVKRRVYQNYLNQILEKHIRPRLWPGYKINFSNSFLVLDNTDSQARNRLHIGMYWRYRADNSVKYYGIMTPDRCNPQVAEVENLKMILHNLGMNNEPGTDYYSWQYFDRTDDQLLRLPAEDVPDCLEEWANVFWNTADAIKPYVEAVNIALKKNL